MSGVIAWFTGLPSSGKSTLAAAVAGQLRLRGIDAITLDSDEVRTAIAPELGYDDAAREQLYTALARLAALLARQGHVVLVPATAHRRAFRDHARALAPHFVEIFVDTPLVECKQRDRKGVYAHALAPGVDVAYEPPPSPDFTVVMGDVAAAEAIAQRIDDSVAP